MIADYEVVTGRQLAERSKGTLDELKPWIEKTKLNNPWTFLLEQYQWGMFTGKLKLTHLANDHYPHPHIQPTSVRNWLAATRPDKTADLPYHNIPRQTA